MSAVKNALVVTAIFTVTMFATVNAFIVLDSIGFYTDDNSTLVK